MIIFLSVWTWGIALAYLSDTSGHRKNFAKSESAAAILSNCKSVGD